MSAGGKGDARRPKQISEEEEQARWDAIFPRKTRTDADQDKDDAEQRDQ